MVTRLAPQKGTDVFAHALDRILALDVQIVVLGSGDPEAERYLAARARTERGRFCAWFPFDEARAHPRPGRRGLLRDAVALRACGLGQLYAKRYGTLPVVRATGGLVDTVTSYDEVSGDGTGFVFQDLDPGSLADTIGWAVSTWYDRPAHIEMMRRRAMREDHSWDQAAREYVTLYLAAYARRRGHGLPGAAVATDTDGTGAKDAAPRRPGRQKGVRQAGDLRARTSRLQKNGNRVRRQSTPLARRAPRA
jgi:starch synthase